MMRKILLLSLVLFLLQEAAGQDTLAYTVPPRPAFIKPELNIISNPVYLSAFYEKLYQAKKLKKSVLNILHIGDSHIQADVLTGTMRQLMQDEFGNAGRGLVFPGRVARTNESSTIYSSSSSPWESKRIVFTNQPLPIGIGAMTLHTERPNGSLTLKTYNTPSLNYAFNKITMFFQKDFNSYNVVLKDSVGNELAYIGPYTLEPYSNASQIQLPFPTNQIELFVRQATPTQNHFTLFGLNLENSKPGVLYHVVGGNGAKFRHYLEATHFIEQTEILHPDLIIISLGTNEAVEHPYIDAKFTTQLDTFVERLKANNPNALFLLTIPADFYKKKTRRNPGVEIIRDKLIAYADEKKIAVWDLYTSAGGKHAADQWKANRLMQTDGVHFTKAGYELQGHLLYEALIKGYNEYVLFRYP